MALNRRAGVHDLELLRIGGNAELVSGHHADYREGRALRLPAFGAAARVIESNIPGNLDRHRLLRAFAGQRPAGEVRLARDHSVVDGGMNGYWFLVGQGI
jgi:hypothetical protein